jgi:hypothetical protein
MRRNARALALALAVCCLSALPAGAQPRPPQISVGLVPGWNNIGWVGATRPVPLALNQIAGRYESVWTWDAQSQRWLGANPLMPAAGDFSELRQNQAYWIRMSAAGEIIMDVPPTAPPVVLTPGWNNFVYPGNEQPVAQALSPAGNRFGAIWRWDAARQGWNGFMPAVPMASDFSTLGPNRPYFVRLADGPQVLMSGPVAAAPASSVTPAPSVTAGTVTPFASPSATPTATPRPKSCYSFQAYQPQLTEVSRALSRAAFGVLTLDPDFKIKELETQPDGDGRPVAPYVPPTLLKAIGWIESGWRQASFATNRGGTGPAVTSTSCAYGLMQLLTGMDIGATPTPKQLKVGTDYLSNIAAGAQMLGIKWNLAPETIPVVLPRNPRTLEDWYFAVWAYHCYGEVCDGLGIHNNPDDPALKWPRPVFNSPDQLASTGQFSFSDYPYQELVYGVIANPPRVNNTQLWLPLPVVLPPHGTVGFPEPKPFTEPAGTLDPTQADAP